MSTQVQRIAAILGGKATLKRDVRDLQDLRVTVEAGLPRASLERAVRHVTDDGRAATELKYRIVAKTTLGRRSGRLSLAESERLERLARLVALAEEVWEGPELAREFLTSPQPQLGGAAPLDLVRSDVGARQVEQLLWSLEHALPV